MVSDFPVFDEQLVFETDERNFTKIIEGIKAVRNRRTDLNVPPSVKAPLYIETTETELFSAADKFFIKMAFASNVMILEKCEIDKAVTAVTADARFFIPLESIVNNEEEIARLLREKAKVQKDIDFSGGKLGNPGFVSKAPAAQIEAERAKLAAAEEKMKKIEESLKAFS
jgi:valyl-tRNA synthetase